MRFKQQAREHFESYDFSKLGSEKHQETFRIMHKATLFSDNDESIDNTEGDSCSHELGCIGGDGLEGTPRMNKFLKSISKSQKDHIWPKSRTPTNYLEEKLNQIQWSSVNITTKIKIKVCIPTSI